MRANIVIAVDAGTMPRPATELQSLFSVLSQIVTLAGHENLVNARRVADLLLQPDLTGCTAADFCRLAAIVVGGEKRRDVVRPNSHRTRTSPRAVIIC